jgi:uncharacterized protein (DUF885 family)
MPGRQTFPTLLLLLGVTALWAPNLSAGDNGVSAAIDALVDRIAVWPGQLTAHDSGGLEILALRELARTRQGEAFDIRAFHDRVLENGAIPLVMLRAHIENEPSHE